MKTPKTKEKKIALFQTKYVDKNEINMTSTKPKFQTFTIKPK